MAAILSPLHEKRSPNLFEKAKVALRDRSNISVDPNVPAASITCRAFNTTGF